MGQHIDVNMHAALNVTTELGSYEWLVARHTVQRQTGRHASVSPTGPTQVQAADGGYVTLGFPPRSARDYQAILDWLEELGLGSAFPDHVLLEMAVERGGVSIVELGQDPIADEIWSAGRAAMAFIAAHVDARTCFDGFQQRGIVCGIVNAPEEVIGDPHFVARGFPMPVDHDDLGRTVTYPGAPMRFSRSPWRIRSRAPHVGEHQGEVLGPLGPPGQTGEDGAPQPGSVRIRRTEPVVQAGVLPVVGAVDGTGQRGHDVRVAPGDPAGRPALPGHESVVGLGLVAQPMGGVAAPAQTDLGLDGGGPHHDHLVLVGEHLVDAGRSVAVLGHERDPLLDHRRQEFELRTRDAP